MRSTLPSAPPEQSWPSWGKITKPEKRMEEWEGPGDWHLLSPYSMSSIVLGPLKVLLHVTS